MSRLDPEDYIVFFVYLIAVSLYGVYVYHRKKKKSAGVKDFFLAEGSLTWWAIGASLIASNISAEHFIGMSGSGFALGLAISTYEWMAAATLIIIAVFFIPIYLQNKIYTMPQFLAKRYNDTVSTIMAIFWILVYVFVNLTSILYLGAIAITSISPLSFTTCIIGLIIFSAIVTLGGMKVIGYTDIIQVAVLLVGGLITTYLALDMLAEKNGYAGNVWQGLVILKEKADSHFHMIFSEDHPYYKDLPGLSVLIGGMWINNLNYWGCNQYITQRALGADLNTARNGILFAAFIKLFIPLIAVLPGIAMFVLHQDGMFATEMADSTGILKPDHAYPTLMNLLPAGLKGIAFAALTAAVVASLAGKANSISTIFSLDIYKKLMHKDASEKTIINIGKWSVVVSLLIAGLVAPSLRTLDQAYQFIQEYVGFISPGVLAIFLFGLFWKRTTSAAALVGTLLTLPVSTALKFLPQWTGGKFPAYAFLDRMTITFFFIVIVMIALSLWKPEETLKNNSIVIDSRLFKISPEFLAGSVIILGVLTGLYISFW